MSLQHKFFLSSSMYSLQEFLQLQLKQFITFIQKSIEQMSLQLQQTIKNNAQDLKEYVTDLYEWEEEMEMKEKAKNQQRKESQPMLQKVREQKEKKLRQEQEEKDKQWQKDNAEKKKDLMRDVNTVKDYYDAWGKYDIDKELEKLEEDEKRPYKPYNPYEDSQNNVRAKPKTKMVVKGTRNVIKDPTSLKDKGNLHFKVCEYDRAIDYYSQCLEKAEEQPTTENRKLRAVVYSNRAMAYIKINQRIKALEDCNRSLELDEKYVKTYLRRADCLRKLGKYRQSLSDYYTARDISDEPEAKIEIQKLEAFLAKRIKETRENMIVENIPQTIPESYRLQIEQVDELENEQINIETNYLEQL